MKLTLPLLALLIACAVDTANIDDTGDTTDTNADFGDPQFLSGHVQADDPTKLTAQLVAIGWEKDSEGIYAPMLAENERLPSGAVNADGTFRIQLPLIYGDDKDKFTLLRSSHTALGAYVALAVAIHSSDDAFHGLHRDAIAVLWDTDIDGNASRWSAHIPPDRTGEFTDLDGWELTIPYLYAERMLHLTASYSGEAVEGTLGVVAFHGKDVDQGGVGFDASGKLLDPPLFDVQTDDDRFDIKIADAPAPQKWSVADHPDDAHLREAWATVQAYVDADLDGTYTNHESLPVRGATLCDSGSRPISLHWFGVPRTATGVLLLQQAGVTEGGWYTQHSASYQGASQHTPAWPFQAQESDLTIDTRWCTWD